MNSTFYGSPDVKKMNLNKWVESQSDYKKKRNWRCYLEPLHL